ncbi:hypothetical protein [Pseudonocardia ailaonensis]|uniref:hypothetical protein n=1 Tax=Pseudonocardia ailaonensis TaxID=367279 RepID=UPI0031D1A9FD
MERGLCRAVPYAPADWRRLLCSVALGFAATGNPPPSLSPAATRLVAALAPAARRARPGEHHLEPRLVHVTVDADDVAELGSHARALGRQLLATPAAAGTGSSAGPGPSAVALPDLVRDLAMVHGLLDLDPGVDGIVLRRWGADGPLIVPPPPEALEAHHHLAGRVFAMWDAGTRS